MARRIIQPIDTSKVRTTETVLTQLNSLADELAGTKFDALLPFTNAYYIVTRDIATAADRDYFKHPEFVEVFSTCFANYYFAAVNDLVQLGHKPVPAWTKLVESSQRDRPAAVSLLMGANAHINYDLPLALFDTLGTGNNALLKDIAKVDKLLMKSAREILSTFEESGRLMSFIKRHGRLLYFRPVMYMIFYWRIMAWRHYLALRRGRTNSTRLAQYSTTIAKRLAWLGARFG